MVTFLLLSPFGDRYRWLGDRKDIQPEELCFAMPKDSPLEAL